MVNSELVVLNWLFRLGIFSRQKTNFSGERVINLCCPKPVRGIHEDTIDTVQKQAQPNGT